jgi:hypothetical protein
MSESMDVTAQIHAITWSIGEDTGAIPDAGPMPAPQ